MSRAQDSRNQIVICLHISNLISAILHRAKPETDTWTLSDAEQSIVERYTEWMKRSEIEVARYRI